MISKHPKSGRWYLRVSVGGRRIQKSLGTADRRVAMAKAAAIIEREERRQAGLWSEVDDAAAKPITEHLDDFMATIKNRGNAGSHLDHRRRVIESMLEGTRTRRVSDLQGAAVARWLQSLRDDGGLSVTTTNHYLSACRQFTRWLLADRRAPYDALALLRPGNRETDRRLVRRALSAAEVEALLAATRGAPIAGRGSQRLSNAFKDQLEERGRTRALVYEMAVRTGLRRREIRTLEWGDLRLGEDPTFTVRAAAAKSRKATTLPLDERVAAQLAALKPDGALPKARVFPYVPNTTTFYADLQRAGIGKGPDDSRVDFHSLRHTFITGLAQKGVHPKVAQTLARHSTMELTMRFYTDLRLLDLRGALREAPAKEAKKEAAS